MSHPHDIPVRYSDHDPRFFEDRDQFTRTAAETVAPLVLALYPVRSVIDLGCGVGTWLSVFIRHGVEEIRGIEGQAVDSQLLQIPVSSFEQHDLTQPLMVDRTYDLAISLEVAEHLPPDSSADFVKTLVGLAPVVLFSAAIPNQGGISHINERPATYWSQQFARHNYVTIDAIRRRIWNRDDIKAWYRQNILLFAHQDMLDKIPSMQAALEQTRQDQLNLVHPQTLQWRIDEYKQRVQKAREIYLGDLARMLPGMVGRAIAVRGRRLLGKDG